jgi:uridine monophosphate synthetase
MGFFSTLTERVGRVDSLLCVGLDPHPDLLPRPGAGAARDYCLRLIEATADEAAAFKPNSAFFEMYGAEGWSALRAVIAAVPAGIPVILDAKRGDIASSATAYARAVFVSLGATAMTASPYLGRDSIEPFLAEAEHGVFLLCKTSNSGSDDLQSQFVAGGEPLYVQVARLSAAWNVADNLGLVVGATDTAALAAVREAAPDLWFLVPGVGEQGGDLRAVLRAGLRADGLGMLISISRSLGRAADPRLEARRLRQEIESLRAETRQRARSEATSGEAGLAPEHGLLADGLLAAGCIRFGQFTLKSGLTSPIYLDLRLIPSYPGLLARVAAAYVRVLRLMVFDRLAALPYAALPIGAAIALQSGWPLIYLRKEVKDYGTRVAVEGEFHPGEKAVVIDDLATTGSSKFEAIDRLAAAGLVVRDVVVLIDRQSGAGEALAAAGYRLHAVLTLGQLLNHWEQTGAVPREDIAATRRFLGGDSN